MWFSYITNCVSWKESYDKPRQHIKKQRHHLAKGPYSQSYGFGASHVHMWELDHEEGWVLKNWCFQIMVLEKTLESPLNWKGIKPVNSKGNQPWVFIGRTDAEAPVLWPPDVKIWLIGKDPDAGRYWGQEGKEATENEMIRMDMSLSKLLVILKDRETCYVVVHRVTKSQTQLSGWTTPPTIGSCSNSCPLSRWCYQTISSSVIPFFCLQDFPASGSFPVSQFFSSGGQSTGASASVLPMNVRNWFPLGLTDLSSL